MVLQMWCSTVNHSDVCASDVRMYSPDGAKGAVAPPFLKSQEVQKNECIDIRTQ